MRKPLGIANAICAICCKKIQRPSDKMFVLGMLAGVYIGFGSQLMTTVTQDLATGMGVGFTQLLGGAVFSVGLMLVVICGAELFTGNNLIIVPCCTGAASLRACLKNWVVVYIANFVGSVLLVLIVFYGALYAMGGYALGTRALAIANAKVNLSFVEALARGIGCNWLVCLAVWSATSSTDTTGKILSCFFPITAFVAMGFEHSVANMYLIPMGLFLKNVPAVVDATTGLSLTNLTWQGFLINNLLPVTIGNIIGGAFFVGTLYWYAYLKGQK